MAPTSATAHTDNSHYFLSSTGSGRLAFQAARQKPQVRDRHSAQSGSDRSAAASYPRCGLYHAPAATPLSPLLIPWNSASQQLRSKVAKNDTPSNMPTSLVKANDDDITL